jgi:hypothetical protein
MLRTPFRGLTLACLGFAAAACTASLLQAAASDASQTEILNRIRSYASRYVSSLPDFMCEQVTYQFEAGKKGKRWHQGDTLTSRLAFAQGKEQRTLQFVNDKPASAERRWSHPLVTEGEFGSLMEAVFSPDSSANFTWDGVQRINGHWVAVFSYAIDKQHSRLKLGLGDLASAILPYEGTISVDGQNGAIWQITNVPQDIPRELETQSIATTIDYSPVIIGGQTYLLPSRAEVDLTTPSRRIRNEMVFTKYRKFEAESTVVFDSAPQGGATEPGSSAAANPPR